MKKTNNNESAHSSTPTRLYPTRDLAAMIAGGYAVLGSLWIFYSGRVLHSLVHDEARLQQLENVKGWFYVAVTAALLWLVLRYYFKEMRLSAEQIQESEARLRLVGDNLPNSYLYQYTRNTDGESRFDYLSAGVQRVHGVSAREVLNDPNLLFAQTDPDQLAERVRAEDESARNLTEFSAEMRIKRADGESRILSLRSQPQRLNDGGIQWNGFVVDITALKRAEDDLRKLSAVVTQSPVSVLITDTNGTIEYVNPRYTEVTGFTPEEVRGQNLWELNSGDTPGRVYENLRQTIGSGGVWHGDLNKKKKDGTPYWVRTLVAPIRDQESKITHFMAVKEDITHQRILEEQFRQSQKMEAIGQLAGGVAHDFNNILLAIMGYGQMALDEVHEHKTAREFISEILVGAERAAALTRQLLAFSRLQVLDMRGLDINEVVRDLSNMVARVIGEHIELQIATGKDLWPVRADAGQMEQVLMNLCVNARDAMPDGGKLIIETENVVLDADYAAEHDWALPGDYVLLSVTDTGIGMSPETACRVFEPFFTTKEVGKGTGLGLATVYGIVQQHGGTIQLYSEVGSGTTFKIYLPAAKSNIASNALPKKEEPRGGSETLLVAEDNDAVRKMAVLLLEKAGYTVLAVEDGVEAIKLFEQITRQEGRKIDLIISDVVMPKLGGIGVLGRLKDDPLCPRFLFSSGYSADAVNMGIVDNVDMPLIQKPYKGKDLLRKVREVLDRP